MDLTPLQQLVEQCRINQQKYERRIPVQLDLLLTLHENREEEENERVPGRHPDSTKSRMDNRP